MAINKVKYGNTTLIDLTGTTATADKILTGYGAYGKDGVWMDGSATAGGGVESVTQDQNGYVILDDDEGTQIVVDPLSVTSNGTYTATTGHAYSPVTVNVPTGVTPTGTISITANGTYNVTNYASAAVNVQSSSGSSLTVKFIDYEGSLLYSYSASQFNALAEMPSLPTHTGLTAVSWTYTLTDAKYAITSLNSGEMDIGVIYQTTDGATHLFIELSATRIAYDPNYSLAFGADSANGYIDWGDNSTNTSILSGDNEYTHTYTSSGSYEIKIVSSANISIGATIDSVDYGLIKRPSTIGSTSFNEITLKKVYLGNHVTTLNKYSFYYCINLEEIIIPTSVSSVPSSSSFLFSVCSSLKSITIPGTITAIPGYFVTNTDKLKTIILCNGIATIAGSAFNNIRTINSITVPSSITAFSGGTSQWLYSGTSNYHCLSSITFLNGITSIPTYSLYNFKKLEEINLPSTLTSIGSHAFDGCNNLVSIDLPSSITSIATYGFANCSNLKSIDISHVTSLGTYSFYECNTLKEVELANMTTIPERCFCNCYSLITITLPSNLTTIGANALYGCGVETMNIPSGLKTINNYGLTCKNLNWTSVPSTITSVGTYGFQGLCKIEDIVIPSGLKTINTGAFSGLTNLTKLTIHNAVTSIAASAFQNSYRLKEIHMLRTTPPTLSNVSAFNNLPSDCVIYVPASDNHTVLEAYKTATNWSTYAAKMQEEPQ